MSALANTDRSNTSVASENAVLVGVILPNQDTGGNRYDPLAELAGLAKAAGALIAGRLIQRRTKVSSGTYLGSGKLEELAAYVKDKNADLIIFDNELTPSQIREIEKVAECRVIDRTELILDIFASRARTHAARLQVELAQLEYTAPRLRGMWTHLERIAGAGGATGVGAVGGIGTRGPGERQIEIDRRLVQKRVNALKDELSRIDARKLREVKSRRDYFTVSLVGYTNAGKSTLMNALTDAGTLVEDKLFATLDTKTRRWHLGEGQTALLSDTVGFVRNLPHNLVASFRATLEETIHSDLLLHVIDASSPDAPGQIRAVQQVLAELGCEDIPVVNVLNKIDAVAEEADLPLLRNSLDNVVEISAARGSGLDDLTNTVLAHMRDRYVRLRVEADSANGRLLAYISRHGHILDREYSDGQVRLEIRVPTQEVPRVVNLGARILETFEAPVFRQPQVD